MCARQPRRCRTPGRRLEGKPDAPDAPRDGSPPVRRRPVTTPPEEISLPRPGPALDRRPGRLRPCHLCREEQRCDTGRSTWYRGRSGLRPRNRKKKDESPWVNSSWAEIVPREFVAAKV